MGSFGLPPFVLLLLSLLVHALAQSRVESDRVPVADDLSSFLSTQEQVSRTPQGAAVMFIQALIQYANGNDEFMREALSKTDLDDGSISDMDRYRLRRVFPFMARSYVDGTGPSDCYALPNEDEISLAFRPQDKYVGSVESGRYKVFVWSGDKDLTARPMTLVRDDDGLWRATEFSSQTLPVASPGAACQVEDVDAAKDTNDGSTFVNTEGVNPNAPSAASMVGAGVGAGVGAAAMALCWL